MMNPIFMESGERKKSVLRQRERERKFQEKEETANVIGEEKKKMKKGEK